MICLPLSAQPDSRDIENSVVYKKEGHFAAWPANHGIWSWDNEIVVGFNVGSYKKNPTGGHDINNKNPSFPKQGRSLDGGKTWSLEETEFKDENGKEPKPVKLAEPIDFSNPNIALKLRSDRLYYSKDRAKSWHGPYQLPTFGRPELLARTDYIIEGKNRVTAFVAASKQNGSEGQPLCMRTTDGGLNWKLVGWIGQEPTQGYGYAIMPATVSLENGGYLSIIRRGGQIDGQKKWWLETFLSPNQGKSWYQLKGPEIDNAGNPATLTRLNDDSIAMVYGWRKAPYGIRAKITQDNGQTWSRELILRSDAASWDIGYPRTILRPDGKCVTIYYYHTGNQNLRFIGCTIWNPEKVWY